MRRLVAFLFHAPGLRLFYRERLAPELLRANRIAIAATLGAMGLAALFLDEKRAAGVLAAWLVGHLAWGAWLARRL